MIDNPTTRMFLRISVLPRVLIGRGEIVETNSGSAIDDVVLSDPLLIYEARWFRGNIIEVIVHTCEITHRNHYNELENRALESTGRFKHIGAQEQMTSDCPDGYCRQKIQAVDNAIGYRKDDWATLLQETDNYDDVMNALRFCEIFKLEAKVSVLDEGFAVKVRNEVMQDLITLASKTMGHENSRTDFEQS